MFEPIAIVGRGCVLPGALTPSTFWENLLSGRDLTGPPPPGAWGVDPASMLRRQGQDGEYACTDAGGYVSGFDEVFDPDGFAINAERIAPLDPLFKWLLYCGREALRDVGIDAGKVSCAETGVVIGNLSYPTRGHAELAQGIWLGDLLEAHSTPVYENRFNSGYPAHLLANALRLDGDAFCLDAACASSLYAIKLACDRLHDRKADLMLAGAVNCADWLFLHIGFTKLGALSPSGRSRPLDRAADGLLPSQGAAIFALKRLDDAISDGNRIYGVIRGIGLSNDGGGRGFLAPKASGQVRAMRAAYEQSGLTPADISYVECHATGTRAGDSVEIKSMAAVFDRTDALPIGSAKANLGHLITASGAAGLLKVLAMMEARRFAPTIHVENPIPEFDGTAFQPQREAAPWECNGPCRAGINSFGLGGNNAHLIVEEYAEGVCSTSVSARRPAEAAVAICGLGVIAGSCRGSKEFADLLAQPGDASAGALDELRLPERALRFPPSDLAKALAQQGLIFEAALEALGQVSGLIGASTGVLIGMGCDAETTRYALRWRLSEILNGSGIHPDRDDLEYCKRQLINELTAAGVVGAMPNIPANRLNVNFDLEGCGFTVSGEELSGLVALTVAARAVGAGELDAALVGAVDLSVEPVHRAAADSCLPLDRSRSGDAGVAMVVKRVEDARRDGDSVLAIIDDMSRPGVPEEHARLEPSTGETDVTRKFGHAHAASGLLHVAAALLAPFDGDGCDRRVTVSSFSGREMSVRLHVFPANRDGQPTRASDTSDILRLPAHLPPVDFAALRRPKNIPPIEVVEVMAEPPPLPAIADIAPVAPLEPTMAWSVGVESDRFPADRDASTTDDAGNPISRLLARTAAVHREFVDRQTRLYREFLAVQEHAATAHPSGKRWAGAGVPPAPASSSAKPEHRARPDDCEIATGKSLTREDLERLASGPIHEVFGPQFEPQAKYLRQVRMPEPPLLLADRVVDISGKPGSMGKGTIRTETDVAEDAWYLHHGRMPTGILIEAGQADLLLISWLGVDLLNKGERVYRLLGCELTFHEGGLPKAGDTLRYEIHVDGHARSGDVRLFFFHYDCRIGDRPVISVREGQAGFFTNQELDESGGVLWKAGDDTPKPDARLDVAPCCTRKRSFPPEAVAAFANGNTYACFGHGFEMTSAHQQTPSIPSGDMQLIDAVPEFDEAGGPWQRGYLRAESDVPVDAWFYRGHFKNDPCMPGTLMAEAAVQALAFAMAALGFTIDRDGWRFEPVTQEAFKFVCRGQVVPDRPHRLTYEVLIEEVIDGTTPAIYAALLCSADGLKVFHCRRFGLRLVPGWPLETRDDILPSEEVPHYVASDSDIRGDYTALLACAWGAPSQAFGRMYRRFDGHQRVPRLPGPPYHCISRILEVDCPAGMPTEGGRLVAEYDVPPDAWYFRENGREVMPLALLVEVLLQPCGWLASYMGFALTEKEFSFRNLDGDDASFRKPVHPDVGTLRTRTTLRRYSRVGDITIVFFRVECEDRTGPVLAMNASFGFFTKTALMNQRGLATADSDRARVDEPSELYIDLRSESGDLFERAPRIARGQLRMIDEITGYWPDRGEDGLGRIRGRQLVDPDSWYFKSHFYEDPVQPGSLGLEALVQLLQCYARLRGLENGIACPRFEPVARDVALVWKYRGQVLPTNKEVVTELEITQLSRGDNGVLVAARGSLWVDGLRIYEVSDLAIRIVAASDDERHERWPLNLDTVPWIADHRPTFTMPVLPMAAGVDFAMRTATSAKPGLEIVSVDDFDVGHWLQVPANGSVDLKVAITRDAADMVEVLLTAETPATVKFATGRIGFAPEYPEPPESWPPLDANVVHDDLYQSGALFHGPSLRVMRRLRRDSRGASYEIDNRVASRLGFLAVLDGSLHGIPHATPETWCGEDAVGHAAYPRVLRKLRLFGPQPASRRLRVEIRSENLARTASSFRVEIQVIAEGKVWCEICLEEILLPKGPIGRVSPGEISDFLEKRGYLPAVRMSDSDGAATVLKQETVARGNWLAGTLEAVYEVRGTTAELTRQIAAKEHVATHARVHPSTVIVDDETAWCNALPSTRFALRISEHERTVVVNDARPPQFDPSPLRTEWRRRLAVSEWPVEGLYFALLRRFVQSIHLDDPQAIADLHGRPALFLANHQVGVESLNFAVAAGAIGGRSIVTIAKEEHRASWLGQLIEHCGSYPGVRLPRSLLFFDRDDQASMFRLMDEAKACLGQDGLSLMVHAEGTRSLNCRRPVERISAIFFDLSLAADVPIVPVRFAGGLPVEEGANAERLEFPLGFAAQDIYIGAPVYPAEIETLALADRRERVRSSMNSLGPDVMAEVPNPPDPAFAEEVAALAREYGLDPPRAAVLHAVECDPNRGAELDRVVDAFHGRAVVGAEDAQSAWLQGLLAWFRAKS